MLFDDCSEGTDAVVATGKPHSDRAISGGLRSTRCEARRGGAGSSSDMQSAGASAASGSARSQPRLPMPRLRQPPQRATAPRSEVSQTATRRRVLGRKHLHGVVVGLFLEFCPPPRERVPDPASGPLGIEARRLFTRVDADPHRATPRRRHSGQEGCSATEVIGEANTQLTLDKAPTPLPIIYQLGAWPQCPEGAS